MLKAEYRKALEIAPNDIGAHLGLATTYFRNMKLDSALPEVQKVLQLDSSDPQASYMMGEILVYQHKYDQALLHLEVALNDTSDLLRVHALLGEVYASQGRTSEAITQLKLAMPGDHDGSYHYQLYRLYEKTGDHAAVAAALAEPEALRKQRDAKVHVSPP